MRSHLTRLTAELSDHHRLLEDLRSLRDSDVRALKEKSHDIEQLRQEVERLAGEIEVLRGVVEEGLKERRDVREQLEEQSRSFHEAPDPQGLRQDLVVLDFDDEIASRPSTPSPRPSPHRATRIGDRTMHTDQATLGSTPLQAGASSHPFISPQEIDRITEELSERRSERSGTASAVSMLSTYSNRNSPKASPRIQSPSLSQLRNHPTIDLDDTDSDSETESATDFRTRTSKASNPPRTNEQHHHHQAHAYDDRRPASRQEPVRQQPTTGGTSTGKNAVNSKGEAPFPQIRGEFLEQLFFSAPEHNANTCTVCHRRRRGGDAQRATAAWRKNQTAAEDEGFAEGSDDAYAGPGMKAGQKGKQRESDDQHDGVPPQTVLARVLRELEDDFTHYKGYVTYLRGIVED